MKHFIGIGPAQVKLAKMMSSILLIGPPFNEKLVRLVAHLYNPAEAEIACHLPYYTPRPLKKIASRVKKSEEEILPILNEMANRKVILKTARGYSLLPLIPGMFEFMLIGGVDTPWHREYARLLSEVFSTGYVKQYSKVKLPAIKSIPINVSLVPASRVMGTDAVFEMIEAHEFMAVANVCQCRQSMKFIDKNCKKSVPEDGCLIFGSFAAGSVKSNNARKVDRTHMRDIVAERREKNLVFFTANITAENPNAICTCCDCCCHFLESVNHYGAKNLIAPPQFLARVDENLCNDCGRCVKSCNTYAHLVVNKKHVYNPDLCIGCGLCVSVCKTGAIRMEANKAYRAPAKGFKALGIGLMPKTAISGFRALIARVGASGE